MVHNQRRSQTLLTKSFTLRRINQLTAQELKICGALIIKLSKLISPVGMISLMIYYFQDNDRIDSRVQNVTHVIV